MMKKHEFLEKNSIVLLIAIILTVLVGGIVEIIPLFRQETVIEPVEGAAEWLRNLIDAGEIADGTIDTRSIKDVTPDDVAGYTF